jgi:hypothetical protein
MKLLTVVKVVLTNTPGDAAGDDHRDGVVNDNHAHDDNDNVAAGGGHAGDTGGEIYQSYGNEVYRKESDKYKKCSYSELFLHLLY